MSTTQREPAFGNVLVLAKQQQRDIPQDDLSAEKVFALFRDQIGGDEGFKAFREALRLDILTDRLAGYYTDDLIITFNGYGDSGEIFERSDHPGVNVLLSAALDKFVTFDWYNNDGGGGDIQWMVAEDKIIINGYYNETVQTDVMEKEEF
jgi:hypothetical protein